MSIVFDYADIAARMNCKPVQAEQVVVRKGYEVVGYLAPADMRNVPINEMLNPFWPTPNDATVAALMELESGDGTTVLPPNDLNRQARIFLMTGIDPGV